MARNKVKLSSVVSSQIPLFARESYPIFEELLEAYFDYLESPGQPGDILTNIETYTKLDFVYNWINYVTLTEELSIFDNEVSVDTTEGFPEENGLLKIGDEIIFYRTKTSTTFEDCTRGFSGVTNYIDPENSDHLVFEESSASEHGIGSDVVNLNSLLLDEFLQKIKLQFAPGFENIEINQNTFDKLVAQSQDNQKEPIIRL